VCRQLVVEDVQGNVTRYRDAREGAQESGMSSALNRLIREEQAQDLIEYALLSALLAVACITGILELTRIVEFFTALGVTLNNAI
jgi:Flp pilus assembly pilin Flp